VENRVEFAGLKTWNPGCDNLRERRFVMERRIRHKELAQLLGVCRRTITRWVNQGVYGVKLRQTRIGRSVGYYMADVDAFRRAVDQNRGLES
jgi:excisionase family DNA binding protein